MISLLYVDLFCGAGGTSTGVELACVSDEQCAKVVACVNHDKNAIASHAANHPDALHFTEDIRTLELSSLVAHVNRMKQIYPEAHVVLWASLECTNFSKAKGGLPRDADSRTLAEHLFRYIEALNPSYIQIENVEEFMSWGDMDANGKPISKDKGRLYERWKRNVKSYGYEFEHKILNAADYGAFTSRRRFFGQFAAKGLPITWPEPSHCKDGKIDMFCNLEKWRPVKDVLDLQDEGESIFNRKKPLADKTLERIFAGLVKFVAGGKDSFMIKWNSMSRNGGYNAPGIDEPCPVVSCQNRLGIANVHFLSKYYSGDPDSKNIPVSGPAHTIKCKDNHALLTSDFLAAYYSNGDNTSSVNSPCPTVSTKDRFNYVQPQFLCSYNFNDAGKDINAPSPTILTKDRLSLIAPVFIDQQYGQSKPASANQPLGCVTANPKYALVTPWLMNTNFSNVGSSLEQPAQTITANRKHHYLMNPQYQSAGSSIDNPCFTLIARMDKTPPYFISTKHGVYAFHNYYGWLSEVIQKRPVFIFKDVDSLCPPIWKIINFMVLYQIVDIKMRMLKIPELKRIMGFPEDYVLIGTQAEKKKYIGNAVEVNMARVLCEAVSRKLRELRKVAA
ncbi:MULTISPECIES: DNA cytosine methyltransferase [unclassified Bacteroides]|jgi:DNA (cytosine-5)-methyltransferase 1|uniref:DNA cytosine methyltransferase n=1 Tax=unclassified Bacteroides TaxID=2646097 RepID=UPI000E97299F|nr:MULTISPECIES: DNA cytosine methyltransferase [unclassified Bacteroides]RGN63276.1 DNA cytosine methyltransferase [Bacteroides sp. OM05-10AA]RGQ66891.1 DNA cytosine methyltransferase [Bacteroides sp. AF27-33]